MKNSKDMVAWHTDTVEQCGVVETGYRVIVSVAIPEEDVLYDRDCGIFETREKAGALCNAFMQSEMDNCEVVCVGYEKVRYIKTKNGIFAKSKTEKE